MIFPETIHLLFILFKKAKPWFPHLLNLSSLGPQEREWDRPAVTMGLGNLEVGSLVHQFQWLGCAHFTTASSILTLILAEGSTWFLHFQICQVFLPSAAIQGRWGLGYGILQNVKVSSWRADSIGVLYVHGLSGWDIPTQKHWLRQTDIPPATERQAHCCQALKYLACFLLP